MARTAARPDLKICFIVELFCSIVFEIACKGTTICTDKVHVAGNMNTEELQVLGALERQSSAFLPAVYFLIFMSNWSHLPVRWANCFVVGDMPKSVE